MLQIQRRFPGFYKLEFEESEMAEEMKVNVRHGDKLATVDGSPRMFVLQHHGELVSQVTVLEKTFR